MVCHYLFGGDLLNPIRQSLNPVVGKHYGHSESQHCQTFNIITQREVLRTSKGSGSKGFQRVYVSSWSRFVPKDTAPKVAPTLILPILTTFVVEIDVFVQLDLVIVQLDLTTPIFYLRI